MKEEKKRKWKRKGLGFCRGGRLKRRVFGVFYMYISF